MSKLYILVTQSSTGFAKALKKVTKKPYNHVSLSTDFLTFYSFCRTFTMLPLPGTFNKEIPDKGVWGSMTNIPCEVYEAEITPEQRVLFNETIEQFNRERRKYAYNVIGLAALYFNINWEREYKFVCSQFCAHALEKIGFELEKPVFLHVPEDFRTMPQLKKIYTGNLRSIYSKVKNSSTSLDRIPVASFSGAGEMQ